MNAFDEEIRAVIEVTISNKILVSAEQLDNYLQGLPRFLPIDDVSAIDVTIVEDPVVSPTYLSVGVMGEFTSLGNASNFTFPDHGLQPGMFCSDSKKMVTIALCDYVINSAAAVYYEVHALQTYDLYVYCIIVLSSFRPSLLYLAHIICIQSLRFHFVECWSYLDIAHFRTGVLIWCA